MEVNPDQVKGWGAVAGIILAIGAWLQKIRNHGTRLKALEEAVAAIPEDIKHRLYDEKSQPIYVPVASCEKLQTKCAGTIEKRMDAMDEKLDTIIKLHLKGESK